jgi:hypothetical protein
VQDVAEELLGPIRRQVGKDDDDCLGDRVVTVRRLSAQEQPLVTADEIDDVGHAAAAGVLRSQPQCLTFPGPGHEGAHGPSAADILVRPGHEGLDPVCDGAERV